MSAIVPTPRRTYGATFGGSSRPLMAEAAVALTYNGSTQAVMMATPADLTDFAYGFSLTEGIARPDEIESVEPVETDLGIDLQIWLSRNAAARLGARRRKMAGPVGCGLCGIDSLEQAVKPACGIAADFAVTPPQVMQAMADLPRHQPLHDAARAAHCAAFWVPGRGIVAAREDVGRHNALDKLAGHLALAPQGPGAVVITSRVSIDIVQKTAAIGAPILIAASAPTDAAVRLAQDAGLTLIALARPDRFDGYTHLHRIDEAARDVA